MFDSLRMKLFVSLIGVAGVISAAFAVGVINMPAAGLADKGDWGELTNNSIEITSTGYVNNPNPFGINISSLDVMYRLKMNGITLAKGGRSGLSIKKNSNQSIQVDTELKTEKVPQWWATHLRNGERSRLEVPLTLEFKVFSFPIKLSGYSYTDTINTSLESKLNKTVSQLEGTYSWSLTDAQFTKTRLEIKGGSARFGEVTQKKSNVIVSLKVHNPNSYPIPTPQFNGGIEMNGIDLAAWRANEVTVLNAPSNAKISPGETRKVDLLVELSNDKIDEWFVSHAAQGEQTHGSVNILLGLNIANKTLTFPEEGIKCGFQFQTGILVDGQESSSSFEGCSYRKVDQESSGKGEDNSSIVEENPLNSSEGVENESSDGSSGLNSLL